MALPSAWIDRIFERLELTYGHRFLSQWPAMAPEVVKAHWTHELDGMERHSDAIAWALQHLPADGPVNVLQFRELCRQAPAPKVKALPQPEPDPQRVAQALAHMSQIMAGPLDRLEPVRKLMLREIAGDRQLTRAQRDFWRMALRRELVAKHAIDIDERDHLEQLRAVYMPEQARRAA